MTHGSSICPSPLACEFGNKLAPRATELLPGQDVCQKISPRQEICRGCKFFAESASARGRDRRGSRSAQVHLEQALQLGQRGVGAAVEDAGDAHGLGALDVLAKVV